MGSCSFGSQQSKPQPSRDSEKGGPLRTQLFLLEAAAGRGLLNTSQSLKAVVQLEKRSERVNPILPVSHKPVYTTRNKEEAFPSIQRQALDHQTSRANLITEPFPLQHCTLSAGAVMYWGGGEHSWRMLPNACTWKLLVLWSTQSERCSNSIFNLRSIPVSKSQTPG